MTPKPTLFLMMSWMNSSTHPLTAIRAPWFGMLLGWIAPLLLVISIPARNLSVSYIFFKFPSHTFKLLILLLDHNQYWHQGMSYQANYCAGLRILDASALGERDMTQLAYFDVSPECATAVFSGSWSNFPYFASGNVVVQSIERGLFIVRLHDDVKPVV